MQKLLPIFTIALFINVTQLYGQGGAYRRITIPASPDSIRLWNARDILPAHFHYENGLLEMELGTREFEEFRHTGIRYRDISDSFYSQQPVAVNMNRLQSEPANFTYGSMNGYYTYVEAMNVLDDMRLKFPSLISSKDTLGYTLEGRPIVAVRISDNPDVQESGEDEWLMTGMHHANEVMGEQIVIYFAWYLLEHYATDKEIRTLLNNSALYIVPVVNPDGLVYNESIFPGGGGDWRKNRKPRTISGTTHYGVDLNRNYGFKRAYTHTGQLGQAGSNFAGNDYYRGTASWSEAEPTAIRNLCRNHRFTAAFNYHAWDDSFNYPWNFDRDSLTDDSVKYKAIVNYCNVETNFETGTFNKTLGYTANGTSDDWLYGEQTEKNKIFAFTIEVGKSFWPAQSLIPVYCDSLLHANLKMLRMAPKYAAITETGADTVRSILNYIPYDIKRYSIRDTVFTVSIEPVDPSLFLSTGTPELYTDLSFLETRSDTIDFALVPGLANGTILEFVLKVDNGTWVTVDTISKVYWSHSTLALDCTDEYEPNNTIGQAKPVETDEKTKGFIDDERDEDWFYVSTTQEKKNIRIVLSEQPEDYDMELMDATGRKVASATRPYRLNDTLVYNASQAGFYRIRVFGFNKAHHPFDCYSLDVKMESQPFAPVQSYAKPVSIDENMLSVFPVPAADNVAVSLKVDMTQNIVWILADNAGRVVGSGRQRLNRGSSSFMIDIRGLISGVYHLQVVTELPGRVLTSKIIKK